MRFTLFDLAARRFRWNRPSLPEISDYLPAVNRLPAPREGVARVMALAEQEQNVFNELLDAARSDEVVAKILVGCASHLTSRRIPCRTPERAVSLLGIESSLRMVSYLGMRQALQVADPRFTAIEEEIWRKSLRAAFLAKELNDEFQLGFKGIEFVSALLHDVGRLVLMLVDPVSAVRVESPARTRRVIAHERSITGTDHCELGCEYALRQNLPLSARRVIRFHHDSLNERNDQRVLTDLTIAAVEVIESIRDPKVAQRSPTFGLAMQRLLAREFAEFADGFSARLEKMTSRAAESSRDFLGLAKARPESVRKTPVLN